MFSFQLIILNYLVKLSHRRSTPVSSETYTFYHSGSLGGERVMKERRDNLNEGLWEELPVRLEDKNDFLDLKVRGWVFFYCSSCFPKIDIILMAEESG